MSVLPEYFRGRQGEFHNPLGRDNYISRQHVERYRFAAARVSQGLRVLDLACGAGYGSAMLLAAGATVTGLDYDANAVASATHLCPSGTFVQGNVLDLPFADGSFDAVVGFEIIEHVVDGRRFLSEIHRVLKPGGQFIGSTPNIHYTAHPDFHVKEYQVNEFFDLVEQLFPGAEHFAQYFTAADRRQDLYKAMLRRTSSVLKKLRLVKAGRRNPGAHGTSAPPPAIASHPAYAVGPVRGEHLLRIMLVVATRRP